MTPEPVTRGDRAIPILPSRSLDRTLAFYARLGFTGEIAGDGYAIVERGDVELHFFRHEALVPAASDFMCYVRVADVDAWHAAFAPAGLPGAGIPRLTPPEETPWGMREFALVDEDGTLVRVGTVRDGA